MGLGFTGALDFCRASCVSSLAPARAVQQCFQFALGRSFAFLEMKLPGYGGVLLMILLPGGICRAWFYPGGQTRHGAAPGPSGWRPPRRPPAPAFSIQLRAACYKPPASLPRLLYRLRRLARVASASLCEPL